jgi:hypothetical protein
MMWIIIGACAGAACLLVLLIIAIIAIRFRKRKPKEKEEIELTTSTPLSLHSSKNIDPNATNYAEISHIQKLLNAEIEFADIVLMSKIGAGASSVVYMAKWKDSVVGKQIFLSRYSPLQL